ncbi:hypothetical protein DPMN_025082 [Dreissena polymorpha]|uniref:Uncharacterized protein n=1 Tax=Dreissena polymorpha TaxID=45954 RepID=A0A9D4LQQ8_DREPO|nr:hypothetical protein DPMN_025082 [Dreissena polymorpha]
MSHVAAIALWSGSQFLQNHDSKIQPLSEESANERTMDIFLKHTTKSCRLLKRDIKLQIGDMNAKIGREIKNLSWVLRPSEI